MDKPAPKKLKRNVKSKKPKNPRITKITKAVGKKTVAGKRPFKSGAKKTANKKSKKS